jgi:hypothetical protein
MRRWEASEQLLLGIEPTARKLIEPLLHVPAQQADGFNEWIRKHPEASRREAWTEASRWTIKRLMENGLLKIPDRPERAES